MTSHAIHPSQFGGYPTPYNTAASAAAEILLNLFVQRNEELSNTVYGTRLGPIHEALEEIEASCLIPNWDGEDAASVRRSALHEAATFVDALPTWVPLPEVAAEPTGDIGIEWNVDSDRVLVVSVGGENRLVYAALLGNGMKQHGVELYSDTVPKVVLQLLERIYGRTNTSAANSAC